jgi:4-amino-4-deoxy-L-arabinose transferase-like glycosyltransferase
MRIALSELFGGAAERPWARWRPRARTLRLAALSAVVLLAAGLRLANLRALGYANHYYTAAVASMLQSWHNFFFVAAEPGGAVSVDKPPVGLWLQAASAYLFGLSGFAVLLPEILAGMVSVIVLFQLVRGRFGTAAGLLAALALAITPVVVATDRNNTIDSTLILVLLLAAWAFSRAAESGRARFVLLGAGLVGLGFNIKMLEAFLPLPAFYALYLMGSPERLWRKLGNLAAATALLAAFSLAWITAVDLTPASQRPYVGSSGNNSELNLAIGYNGLQRLAGMGRQLQGGLGPLLERLLPGGASRQPGGSGPAGGGPASFGRTGPGIGSGGLGALGIGQPGLWRLFTPPLSKEVSWLLPFGLFALALLALGTSLRWPVARNHQAALLWGGWLVTAGLLFSVAGFFHEYYLSTIGAPLAALVGIGSVMLWRLGRVRPWVAVDVLLISAGTTLALQLVTATWFAGLAWWLGLPLALFVTGAAVLLAVADTGRRGASLAGFSFVMGALFITPGIWSGLTTAYPSANQSLPAAYSGQASSPANHGALQVNQRLLSYLQANTQGQEYLVAVPSSMQGSDYVIATGRPVLYLGGFMGTDPVVAPGGLARLAASGQLRFVYWDARGRGRFGQQLNLSNWLAQNCRVVPGFEANTQNAGAPDGLNADSPHSPNGRGFGFGGLLVSLYDCAQ